MGNFCGCNQENNPETQTVIFNNYVYILYN